MMIDNYKVIYLGAEEGYDSVRSVLTEKADVFHLPAEIEALAEEIHDATAIIDASMKVRITDAMVDSAPDLRIISCATTGSDHIARNSLQVRNIPVRTLKEDKELLLNITPAAELSWALLLACARSLTAANDHVKLGGWTREEFPGVMLNGKQLGLIGCGRIGGWMSRYATAFGMTVVGYDPYASEFPENCTSLSCDEVLASSDFISIHVHLSEETRGMISKDRLARVKPNAILINTSRGAIIDENALLESLVSGAIGAAGLDVLDGEPDIASHALVEYARTHSNLIITPHCGGFSPDAVRIVCQRAAEKVAQVLGV